MVAPASATASAPPPQHLARHFVAERAVERQHVERARGLAAHGEHVGERVGRGDASEIVRVVDERREEIDGEDGGHVVGYAVDGGVIAGLEPEQQVIRVRGCVVSAFQDGREDVGEVSRTPLCSSTALRGELGKTYAFLIAQGALQCFVFVSNRFENARNIGQVYQFLYERFVLFTSKAPGQGKNLNNNSNIAGVDKLLCSSSKIHAKRERETFFRGLNSRKCWKREEEKGVRPMQLSRRGFFQGRRTLRLLRAWPSRSPQQLPALAVEPSSDWKLVNTEEYTNICCYCAGGCGSLCSVRDGELINLEGDPDHPINKGGLCPKGATMFQLATSSTLRRARS